MNGPSADLFRFVVSLIAVGIFGYLIAGCCVAAFFVAVIDPSSANNAEFLCALILTWPAFVVMAAIFWFAAGV